MEREMNTICTEASRVRQMLDAAAGWRDIDELVSKMDEAGLFFHVCCVARFAVAAVAARAYALAMTAD